MAITLFVLLLAVCSSLVQGQGGDLTIRFPEADFANHEDERILNVEVLIQVSGGQPGRNPLEFRIEALTKPQFNERVNAPESTETQCINDLTPQDDSFAEVDDLVVMTVNCSGAPPPAGMDQIRVNCSFLMTQDGIYELNEFLVLIMTVTNDGGNSILIERNCAVGRILANDNPQNVIDFNLRVMDETLSASEGETVYIEVERVFLTEEIIQIDIRTNAVADGDSADPDFGGFGGDFVIDMSAQIPPNVTSISIPMIFSQDTHFEPTEGRIVILTATILSTTTNVPVISGQVEVTIFDDEVLTAGFVSGDPRTITEGESVTLELELKNYDPLSDFTSLLTRPTAYNITTAGSAVLGRDYTVTRPATINFYAPPITFTIETLSDSYIEPTRTIEVNLVDTILAQITDNVERQRYEQLNRINPGTVTITILDNGGTPNRPVVTFTNSEVFSWETDDEGGARPVTCHYGNITTRTEGPDGTTNEVMEEFDFCQPGQIMTTTQHVLPNFSPSNEYIVVVCSRNSVGTNCSETFQVVFELLTTAPQPMTTTPQPMTTTPQPMTTTPQPMTTTPQPMTTTPQPMTTTPQPINIGTPNRPVVTFTNSEVFSWETDDEEGARPVTCHYGTITTRTEGPDGTTNEVMEEFDYCQPGQIMTTTQHVLPNFSPSNEYIVVVCSRNSVGTNCSETFQVVFELLTTAPQPMTTTPQPMTTTPQPMTTTPQPINIGTPNRPVVTFTNSEVFSWETDDEEGARPITCHYGTITTHTEGPDGVISEVEEFDYCQSGQIMTTTQHVLPNFSPSNRYTVMVCSRNPMGTNCSEPAVFEPIPTVVGATPGAIVGIVVGCVLGCCLFWLLLLLLLLLLLCCCRREQEKRYFPQRREEKFAAQGKEYEHYAMSDDYMDV